MTKMNATYLKQRLNLISKEIIKTHKYRSSIFDKDAINRYFNIILPAGRAEQSDLPDNDLEATLILMGEYLKKIFPKIESELFSGPFFIHAYGMHWEQ